MTRDTATRTHGDISPFAARATAIAARVAGSGAVRNRYRQEFLAELHDLPRFEQAWYAARVLSQSWKLRVALRPHENPVRPRPLTAPRSARCYLRLHHSWAQHRAVDGSSTYRLCARCGKYADPTGPSLVYRRP